MTPIYHITTQPEWEAAQAAGNYEAASLHTEGFIHCSTASQVAGVRERYFRGINNIVLLTIDPLRLEAPLKYERSPSQNEDFPHVFGPIPVSAVVATGAPDSI